MSCMVIMSHRDITDVMYGYNVTHRDISDVLYTYNVTHRDITDVMFGYVTQRHNWCPVWL